MLDRIKSMITRSEAAPDAEHDELLVRNHPLAKKLPVAALFKFDALCAERDRAYAPLSELHERRNQLLQDAQRKEADNQRWQDQSRRAYGREDFDAEVKKQSLDVASMRAKAKEIAVQAEAQSVLWTSVGNLVRRVENYALALTAVPAMHPGTPPPSGDPVKAAEKARTKIAALKDERAAIEAAPWPSSVVKAKVTAEIDAAAALGRPDVFRAIEENLPVEWPTVRFDTISNGNPGVVSVYGINAFAMFAWLHRDRLLEMTLAEIDARADDAAALGQKEREAKRVDVAKRLLAAERDFEAAILASGYEGAALREHNQDPRAVLGLADDAPVMADFWS